IGEVGGGGQAIRHLSLHQNLAVVDLGEAMPAAGYARASQVAEVSGGQGELIDYATRRERYALSHEVAVVVVRSDLARPAADDPESAVLNLDAAVRPGGDEELL